MNLLLVLLAAGVVAYVLKSREQGARVALLGQHLGAYQIEALIEAVTQGYMRALGEKEPLRQQQIWQLLGSSEGKLRDQLQRLAADFSKVSDADAAISNLPPLLSCFLPFLTQLFPQRTMDMRRLLAVHAQGLAQAVDNADGRDAKARAHCIMAEIFLMQHSCHWYCRSYCTASARLHTRHGSTHGQALASVGSRTRLAYAGVTGV